MYFQYTTVALLLLELVTEGKLHFFTQVYRRAIILYILYFDYISPLKQSSLQAQNSLFISQPSPIFCLYNPAYYFGKSTLKIATSAYLLVKFYYSFLSNATEWSCHSCRFDLNFKVP